MSRENKEGLLFLVAFIIGIANIILMYWLLYQMKKTVDIGILKGCFEILKKYFIVQEFTSVYKITESEKQLYNKLAKIIEGKNVK